MEPLRNLQILIVEAHEFVQCQPHNNSIATFYYESKHRMCGRQQVVDKSPGVGSEAKLSLLQYN